MYVSCMCGYNRLLCQGSSYRGCAPFMWPLEANIYRHQFIFCPLRCNKRQFHVIFILKLSFLIIIWFIAIIDHYNTPIGTEHDKLISMLSTPQNQSHFQWNWDRCRQKRVQVSSCWYHLTFLCLTNCGVREIIFNFWGNLSGIGTQF